MYNRIYILFNDKHLIYPLNFGFRQKWNIDCDIFVDLKEAFDTVEHNIVLLKVEYYGWCVLAKEWFKSLECNDISLE